MDLNAAAKVALGGEVYIEAPSAAVITLKDKPAAFAEQEPGFLVR